MNQTQMYDHMRAQMRKVAPALAAMAETLKVSGSEILPFNWPDKYLYVRCDGMPPHSIKTIDFLAGANFLTWKIVAINRAVEIDGEKAFVATPYICIYYE